MAAHLRIATSFKISRTLFRKDDGLPYRFFYEHDSEDLRIIIRKGLGCLVSDPAEADILLCEKRTDNRITQGYLPVDFIVDCVKRNTFLNVDTYRTDTLGLKASASKDESLNSHVNDLDSSEDERNLVKFSEPVHIKVKSNGLSGRKKYSDIDDYKIINYLISHDKYTDTGGNIVWKQMELVKVTDHSYQSMKARFQKKILPEIDTYRIPGTWKAKLCGRYVDDSLDEEEGAYDDASTSNMNVQENQEKLLRNRSHKRLTSAEETDPSNRVLNNAVGKDQSSTSRTFSVDAALKNQRLSAACSSRDSEANMQSSCLEPVTADHSDSLVHRQMGNGNKASSHAENDNRDSPVENNRASSPVENNGASSHVGNREDISVHQALVNASKGEEAQNPFYVYDDLDMLILSEAGKRNNFNSVGKSSNHTCQDSAKVITAHHAEVLIDSSCNTNPPCNSRTVKSPASGSSEVRNSMKDNAVISIGLNCIKANLSTDSEKRNLTKHINCNQQQVAPDKVVEASKEQSSVNRILNIIRNGSFKSGQETNSLLPKKNDSELKDTESDICHNTKSAQMRATMRNRETRSISPVTQAVRVHPRRMRQEKEITCRSDHESAQKSPSKVNQETNREPYSDVSDECVTLQIRTPMKNHKRGSKFPVVQSVSVYRRRKSVEKHKTHTNVNTFAKSLKKFHKRDIFGKTASESLSENSDEDTSGQYPGSSGGQLNAVSSSKPKKRTLEADKSFDSTSGASYSPHKKKRVQESSLEVPNAEYTRLSSLAHKSPWEGDSSCWYSRKEVQVRVKALSEIYGLEMCEAALLLKLHGGNFVSAVTRLETC